MQPEPKPRAGKPFITAAVGIALVAVAAVTLVGTAVFSSPGDRTDTQNAAAESSNAPSDDPSASATPSPTVPATLPTLSPTVPAKPPATTKPPAKPPVAQPSEAGFEATVLTIVNQERATAGCPAVTSDARLAKAAKAHSADMAARNFFDHTTPEGVAFSTRIKNAGYSYSTAGENIAAGQKDPAAVMKAWMNSSGHRANILNCSFRNLGVGLAYNAKKTPYWTQDFATPR